MRSPPVSRNRRPGPALLPIVPVGLRVDGRPILVVGAGPIAARKARTHVDQGAIVTVVAPRHSREMSEVPVTRRLYRRFEPSDLDGVWLVVTATGNTEVDGLVFAEAEARKIWCNAADDPRHCSVILPAVSRRGMITVAIGTGGASPAIAGWIRRRIDELIDEDTLAVARIAGRVREAARDAELPTEVPGWADVLDREALDLVGSGRPEQLERRLWEAVAGHHGSQAELPEMTP